MSVYITHVHAVAVLCNDLFLCTRQHPCGRNQNKLIKSVIFRLPTVRSKVFRRFHFSPCFVSLQVFFLLLNIHVPIFTHETYCTCAAVRHSCNAKNQLIFQDTHKMRLVKLLVSLFVLLFCFTDSRPIHFCSSTYNVN